MSTFGAAFDKLPHEHQRAYIKAMSTRKLIYMEALRRGYRGTTKAVIIGDTPGPGRPTDPHYHHTPFYSTKHSSFWLNRQLVEAGIDESTLLWFNAQLADGSMLDGVHIQDVMRLEPKFICLGGNAEKWFRSVAPTSEYVKIYHPQYAKRFRSKEEYELIAILKELK